MSQENLIINIGAKTSQLEKELRSARTKVVAFGSVLTASGAAAVAAINEYRKYEKALIGVGKTTGLTGKALKKYGDKMQDLSVQTGQSANSLLEISQAAGQLGVTGSERLQKFTDTIAKLGTASDLQGEEAATTLTRILNVTGEGVDNIDQFASVIVRLGNNFAASESEIARMAQEVSRATAVFGVSSAESAALGTALKSVGVQAELGGSVVGKSFRTIDDAIRNGGAEFEALQVITGMTGDQLKETFEKDSTAVFQKFVEGLGRVKTEGGSVAEVLETFGLKGDEVNKVLPVLAERSDLLGDALSQAGDEVKKMTALENEFAAQNDTLDQNFKKLTQSVVNLATDFGKTLAPAVNDAVKEMTLGINLLHKEMDKLILSSKNLHSLFLKLTSDGIRSTEAFLSIFPGMGKRIQETNAIIQEHVDKYKQGEVAKTEALDTELGKRDEKEKEYDAHIQAYRKQLAEEVKQKAQAEYEEKQGLADQQHATELERLQQEYEEKLLLQGEQHEADIERLRVQLDAILKEKTVAAKKELSLKEKAEAELSHLKTQRVSAEKTLDNVLEQSAFDTLSSIVGNSKAAQAAIIVARKAYAIANTLINAKEAAALAIATVPPPLGEDIAAQRIVTGNILAATIAATAVPQLASTFAAKDGGIVPGASMGDKPFGWLEGEEIIVPASLNKTFQELFPSFPESEEDAQSLRGGGTQSVSVIVGLTDDAADILTVQQYESKIIGTSR